MKIILRIGEDDKTFINDFVKGRVFRNALMLNKKLEEEGQTISVDLFDTMIEFVTSAFDQKFTVDEFWDGVRAENLQSEVMRIFNEILDFGGVETKGTAEGNEAGE